MLLTHGMCTTAFAVARQGLRTAARLQVATRDAGTLVVIDPFVVPSSIDPALVSLDEAKKAALFIGRVDENHPSAERYDEIALTKARDLWVVNRAFPGVTSNLAIQQLYPHLYRPGMTKWHGGTCQLGIPITFSGVQGHLDEAIAKTVEAWLAGMARLEADKVMASNQTFIGERADT